MNAPVAPYVAVDREGHVAIVVYRDQSDAHVIELGNYMRGMSIGEYTTKNLDYVFKPYNGYDVSKAAERFLKAGKNYLGGFNVNSDAEATLRKLQRGNNMSDAAPAVEVNTPTPKTTTDPAAKKNAPKPVPKAGNDAVKAAKKPSKAVTSKPINGADKEQTMQAQTQATTTKTTKRAATKKTAAKPATPVKKASAPAKKTAAKKTAAPAKKAAKKTSAGGAGRAPAIADDAKITVVPKENPLRDGSNAHKLFGKLKSGMTFADALKATGGNRPYLMAWIKMGHLKAK